MNQRRANPVLSILIGVLTLGFLGLSSCKKSANEPPKTGVAAAEANLKATPSFENHIALGLELANAGDTARALEMYQKAREMNPKSPLAWNNICATYNSLGKPAEALSYCEKAVELEPNFALAQNNLAWTRGAVKGAANPVPIAERKKQLLAKAGATGSEYLALGFEFYNAKDHASAIELWSKVKASDAEYAKAQNNIATSNIILGHLDKAERALNIALGIEPKNQLFINNRTWLEQTKKAKK